MIIPVKCFTCGKVIGNMYEYYLQEVRRRQLEAGISQEDVVYLTKNNVEKTIQGKVLDDLKLNKMCCRRHMLTHVDII
jgi:DNA-directed RNA polymerase I, II, and III subunit RPABC5